MGIQVVLHQDDLLGPGKVRVGQVLEDLGIIHTGVAIDHFDMPPAFQWREYHEQVSWLGRYRNPGFGDELLRRLIHADHWERRIVRPLINLENIFQGGYERGVGVRGDDPLLLEMRLELVFFGSYSVFCWSGPRPMAPRIMAAEFAV